MNSKCCRFASQRRTFCFAAICSIFLCGSTEADITFTFSPSLESNNTILNIFGLGISDATTDSLLSVASNGEDTFIRSDTPNLADAASISPVITLADSPLSLDFLGDFNSGSRSSPESFVRFTFPSLRGDVDLSDLTGEYELSGVPFSSFVPGSYRDLNRERNTRSLSTGTLNVEVVAIPEPSSLSLCAMSVLGYCTRRKR